MSQNNSGAVGNGRKAFYAAAIAGVLGSAGTAFYYLDSKIDRISTMQQFRGERISSLESDLRALRLERDRGLSIRDKELAEMRAEFPEIPVVLLTAHGTVETAVEAMKRGAHDFLTKPFDREKILEIVGKAVAQAERARREFQGPLAQDERCGLVGAGPAMDSVRQMVERVAVFDDPVPTTVPHDHRSGAVVSGRDDAFEIRVLNGVILDVDRQPLLFGPH